LPEPVTRIRLDVPLWVFIFGISVLFRAAAQRKFR
jgi:hypothetical protein